MAYTKLGGTEVFTDLLEKAGLQSPFDDSCLRDIAVKTGRWLEDFEEIINTKTS